MDPRVRLLKWRSGWKKFERTFLGSDICIEKILVTYSAFLFEMEEADTNRQTKTHISSHLEWYFGLPAVPSRAKSTRKGTKAETSLALPGAGTGKEPDIRSKRRVQKASGGRATSRLAPQTLVRGLEGLSREVIDGGVYSVLYIKSSSHHLVQLLFLEHTARKKSTFRREKGKIFIVLFSMFLCKMLAFLR